MMRRRRPVLRAATVVGDAAVVPLADSRIHPEDLVAFGAAMYEDTE